MSKSAGQVTVLLRAVRDGRPGAVNELIGLIYQELRRIAQGQPGLRHLKNAPPPTALVHEAYLRLFATEAKNWENRYHFFWAAARAMRDVLVEEARRQGALKRGGDVKHVELHENVPLQAQPQALIDLDEALNRLAEDAPEAAKVVMLHFFGGQTFDEIAELANVSSATVRRRWAYAKAWLHRDLVGEKTAEPMSEPDSTLRLV